MHRRRELSIMRVRDVIALVAVAVLTMVMTACAGDEDEPVEADVADTATTEAVERPADIETTEAMSDDAGGEPTVAEADASMTEEADAAAASEGGVPSVEMVVFNPPSLGAFLPAVIEDQGFDVKNGIDIQFVGRPPDAYNTEFASGQYPLGGSAALLSEAVRVNRGVDVQYLFNLFDYFGAVVSTTPEITELADLPGHSLAAATTTTNYAMFQYFAQQQGVELANVTVQNTAPPGLIAQALTGRSDAVQLWEPAFSILREQAPDSTVLDLGITTTWEGEFGFTDIPYLGVAAQADWVADNPDLLDPLFATYEETGGWVLDNPAEAAEIIAATIPDGDPAVIQELIENNDRLGLNVQRSSQNADAIRAVFQAGLDSGYLEELPADTIIPAEGS